MSYHLLKLFLFQKNPYGCSIFRGLYFGQIKSDFVDFGVNRHSSMGSTIVVQTDHFYIFLEKTDWGGELNKYFCY